MRKLIAGRGANFCLWVIVSVFVVAVVASVFRNHIAGWDESVYIGMGKYLFSFGKIGGWEIMRPVALPVLLGFMWKVGFNPVYSAKILAVVFSVVNILLVCLIGKRLFGELAGLVASLFLAITPVFFFNSSYGLTDISSTAFSLLAVYLLIRRSGYFLVGVLAGMAFLFRFPQGIFFAALLASIFIAKLKSPKVMLKRIFLCSAGFIAAGIPFLVFNYFMYRGDVVPLVAAFRPLIFALGEQGNPFYPGSLFFYPLELFKSNPLLVFSVVGLFCFLRKENCKLPKVLIFLALAFFLVYFSYIASKVLRFALVFLPYLCLFAGYGFGRAMDCRGARYVTVALLALAFIVGIPLAFYLVSFSNVLHTADHSITEFYSYFNDHPINGTVLITMPHPLAYSDMRFKPVYYLPEEPFSGWKGDVSAVMLTNSTFVCVEGDAECGKRTERFLSEVQNGTLVFSERYANKSFRIYLVS